MLDIDNVLKFLAIDVTFVNTDGYWTRASDYNIYMDPKGVFHLIPHDANETFGPGGRGRGGPMADSVVRLRSRGTSIGGGGVRWATARPGYRSLREGLAVQVGLVAGAAAVAAVVAKADADARFAGWSDRRHQTAAVEAARRPVAASEVPRLLQAVRDEVARLAELEPVGDFAANARSPPTSRPTRASCGRTRRSTAAWRS